MFEIVRPIFLAVAGGAALIPIALHFLAHREGVPRPLPTARFLEGAPRLRPRFERRPSHPLLLLLRVLFVLFLGAAFAGVRWVPAGDEVGHVLVVDVGEGMGEAAAEGLRWAEGRAADAAHAVVVTVWAEGEIEGRATEAGEVREPSLVELLEAARVAAGEVGTPRVRLTLVTRLREGSWSPDLLDRRRRLWPGAIELVGPPEPSVGDGRDPLPAILLHHAPGGRGHLEAALRSLDGRPPEVELVEGIGDRAPWGAEASWPGTPPRALLLSDGTRVFGPWRPLAGGPGGADATPLLWEGGRPAGAVRRGNGGAPCQAVLALEWTREEGPFAEPGGEWVRGVQALLDACVSPADRSGWDPGPALLAQITGAGLPSDVAARELEGIEVGRSLDRLLLAVLLLLAGVEAVMVMRRRVAGEAPG